MTNLQKNESVDDTMWPASCRTDEVDTIFICALEIHGVNGLY